jgi:hypothetical protein
MARQGDRLSAEQVRDVLLAIGKETLNTTAKRVDRTAWVISQIQRGQKYADVHPELPRRPGRPKRRHAPQPTAGEPSCRICQHWIEEPEPGRPPCDLGLPDVHEVGLGFATECNLYQMQR